MIKFVFDNGSFRITDYQISDNLDSNVETITSYGGFTDIYKRNGGNKNEYTISMTFRKKAEYDLLRTNFAQGNKLTFYRFDYDLKEYVYDGMYVFVNKLNVKDESDPFKKFKKNTSFTIRRVI